MNRRTFFSALAATLVADPERALWVPGKKLISIPKPVRRTGDIVTIDGFYRTDPFTREATNILQEFVVGEDGQLSPVPWNLDELYLLCATPTVVAFANRIEKKLYEDYLNRRNGFGVRYQSNLNTPQC